MTQSLNDILSSYFLPYQIKWLNDDSKIKISEKSRRIGMTYVQSYEDVRDCIAKKVPSVWFSSADESAAKEYIFYCGTWAKIFNVVAEDLGEIVIDEKKCIKAFVLQFQNGTRIHAMSSNPKGFRSKGGKVILDEFAFHGDAAALWKAARPCITWGFPLRILSTHNGQNCKYFNFIQDVKKGKLKWSLHTTTIYQAVAEGLADKILGRKLTDEERQAWIDEERASCGDEATWNEEYCCIAIDESTAFLTYELIRTCQSENIILSDIENIEHALSMIQGDMYVGMDIARKKHFSVITVLEKLGDVKYTRIKKELLKMPFKDQEAILYLILAHKNLRRACIDATGLGMQLAEGAQTKFGKYRVEPITFTASTKETMAYLLLTAFEDRKLRLPYDDQLLTEDLHSIKKTVSLSGNIRFDVEASETDGHADRFWSYALANYAATTKISSIPRVSSRKRRASHSTLEKF